MVPCTSVYAGLVKEPTLGENDDCVTFCGLLLSLITSSINCAFVDQFEAFHLMKGFKIIYKCIESTKIRNFQIYRLMHRILGINSELCKWKIKDSPLSVISLQALLGI